jgi:hypothetical protein
VLTDDGRRRSLMASEVLRLVRSVEGILTVTMFKVGPVAPGLHPVFCPVMVVTLELLRPCVTLVNGKQSYHTQRGAEVQNPFVSMDE